MIMVDSSELISCRFVRYYQHEGAKSSYHTAYGVRYENERKCVLRAEWLFTIETQYVCATSPSS